MIRIALVAIAGMSIGVILGLGSLATIGSGHGSPWPAVLSFGLITAVITWTDSYGLFLTSALAFYGAISVALQVALKTRRAAIPIVIFVAHWISVIAIIIWWKEIMFYETHKRIRLAYEYQQVWFLIILVFQALFQIFVLLLIRWCWHVRRKSI